MEVRKARHVPNVVEYAELTADNGPEVADWCGGEWVFGALLVPTIIGQVRPTPDASWLIVKGTQGEYYPVRADVFVTVYEPQLYEHAGMGVCNKGRRHVPPCDYGEAAR